MSRGIHVFIDRLRDNNHTKDYEVGDAVLQEMETGGRKHLVGIVTHITKGKGVTVLVSGSIPLVDLPVKYYKILSQKEANLNYILWNNNIGRKLYYQIIPDVTIFDKMDYNINGREIGINDYVLDNRVIVGFVMGGHLHVTHAKYHGLAGKGIADIHNVVATTTSSFKEPSFPAKPVQVVRERKKSPTPPMSFADFKKSQTSTKTKAKSPAKTKSPAQKKPTSKKSKRGGAAKKKKASPLSSK